MKNTEILQNIIDNLQKELFEAAQEDCKLLPQVPDVVNLSATIGAIESQPTKQAYQGIKSAAMAMADKLIGRI